MSLLVSAKPRLEISSLLPCASSKKRCLVCAFSFFQTGSDAMIGALEGLGVVKGARIALPAYVCRSVPDRLSSSGYKPVYYDIGADLLIPLDRIQEMVEDIKVQVVLLIDYFGFLAEENTRMAGSLNDLGVVVLVDRCHSILSRQNRENTDAFVDAVFYSIRKTLPVNDGGALCYPKSIKNKSIESSSWFRNVPFVLRYMAESFVLNYCRFNIYSEIVTKLRTIISAIFKSNYSRLHCDIGTPVNPIVPSAILVKQLRNRMYLSNISEVRRRNYKRLSKIVRCNGLNVVFNRCVEGVVPQVLPVLDPSGSLVIFMRQNGVGAYRWPGNELPTEVTRCEREFVNSTRLNRELVCLPIHQSLSERHITRMAELMRNWRTLSDFKK